MDIREFKNTYRDYAPYLIWDWCAKPSLEEIDSQLSYFSDMGIRGVYIRPSKGLCVPYLSDDFFELVRTALRRSTHYGIDVWLFDENSLSSGNCGGEITSVADYRMCDLVKIDKSDLLKTDNILSEESMLIVLRDLSSERGTGRSPISDITDKFVTQCFLEESYDKYIRSCKRFLGYELKGFVTSVNFPKGANLYSSSAFEMAAFPDKAKFAKKLLAKDKDTIKAYYASFSDAICENYLEPLYNKCSKNALSLSVAVQGDNTISRQKQYLLADSISLYASHIPSALELKLAQSISAQFDKELNVFLSTGKFASAAERFNLSLFLCAMGVHRISYDSVAFSLTDRRKYEDNSLVLSSFSEKDISERIARFSKVISQTCSYADTLLVMNSKNIGFFSELCTHLQEQNIDFHIVEEDVFTKYSSFTDGSVCIGNMVYTTLIYEKDFDASAFSGKRFAVDTSLSAKNCVLAKSASPYMAADNPIYINRRHDDCNDYIFITAQDKDTAITITKCTKKLFCADSSNGEIYEMPNNEGSYSFILKSNKTVLLICSDKISYDLMPPHTDELSLKPSIKKCEIPFAISCAGENILPLKCVNACFGRKAYRESNVDNLHKEFYALPDGETVKAKYPFYAELSKIGKVKAYFENAQNFDFIEINGHRLDALKESKKDCRFSGVDITPYIADGKNTIAVEYEKQNNYTPNFESFAPSHLYSFNPTSFEPVYLAGEFDFDGEKLTELSEYAGDISNCGMPYYYGSLTYTAILPESSLLGASLSVYGDFDICKIKIGKREKTFYSQIPTIELFNLDCGSVCEITIFNTPYNLLRSSSEKAMPFGISKILICE